MAQKTNSPYSLSTRQEWFERNYPNPDYEQLSDREQEIIKLFFGVNKGKPMTLSAIGRKYGVSSARIGKLKDYALNKLGNINNG